MNLKRFLQSDDTNTSCYNRSGIICALPFANIQQHLNAPPACSPKRLHATRSHLSQASHGLPRPGYPRRLPRRRRLSTPLGRQQRSEAPVSLLGTLTIAAPGRWWPPVVHHWRSCYSLGGVLVPFTGLFVFVRGRTERAAAVAGGLCVVVWSKYDRIHT